MKLLISWVKSEMGDFILSMLTNITIQLFPIIIIIMYMVEWSGGGRQDPWY